LPEILTFPLDLSPLSDSLPVNLPAPEQTLLTPSSASDINRVSIGKFNNLPAEILHCVTDFLGIIDAVSLTLCSRDILQKLGSKHFKTLNIAATPEPNPEFPFGKGSWKIARRTIMQSLREELILHLLDAKVSDCIYCYYCEKIHHPSKTGSEWGRIGDMSLWRKCSEIEQFRTGTFHIQDGFTYSNIQALMQRYRDGQDYSSLMKDLTKTTTLYRENCTIQTTIQPRIRDGKFLVRSQHRLLLKPEGPNMANNWSLQLCAHYFSFGNHSRHKASNLYALDKIIKCKLSHKGHPCIHCSGLIRCKDCCTEFQIDVNTNRNRMCTADGELIAVFSAWQDFGEGRTPFDPKWVRRFVMFPGTDTSSGGEGEERHQGGL
jgi:hypothetical protein